VTKHRSSGAGWVAEPKHGLPLIELLVVIAIIAILAAHAAARVAKAKGKAQQTTANI